MPDSPRRTVDVTLEQSDKRRQGAERKTRNLRKLAPAYLPRYLGIYYLVFCPFLSIISCNRANVLSTALLIVSCLIVASNLKYKEHEIKTT